MKHFPGILIVAAGLMYSINETRFFGWNVHATSPAELIADGIGLIVVSIGVLTGEISRSRK